jgi:hypothetical protein
MGAFLQVVIGGDARFESAPLHGPPHFRSRDSALSQIATGMPVPVERDGTAIGMTRER